MTPWLDVCRYAVGDIKAVLVELPTRIEREPVLQTGEGGDETTAIDAAAETAVVHRLEQLDDTSHLVDRARLAGVDGDPEAVLADAAEQSSVVGDAEGR